MKSVAKRFGSGTVNILRQKTLIALSVGLLAILLSLAGTRFVSYKMLIIALGASVFVPLVIRWLGVAPLLCVYAAFVWVWYTLNYYFLSDLLAGATVFEVGIYLGLLVLVFGPNPDRNKLMREFVSTPFLLPLFGFVTSAIVAYKSGPDAGDQNAFILMRRAVFYGSAIYLLIANTVRKTSQAVHLLEALVLGGTFFGVLLTFHSGGTWDVFSRLEQTRSLGYSYMTWDLGLVQAATYLSTLLPVAVSLAVDSSRAWWQAVLFTALSGLLGVMLVLSEGRGGWVAGVAGVLIVLILSILHKGTALWKVVGATIAIAAAISLLATSGLLSATVFDRIESFRNLSTDRSLSGRLVLWEAAWRMLVAAPLGVGPLHFLKTFGYSPHNEFFQLALTSGFLGLFSFVAFYFGAMRKYLKALDLADPATRMVCVSALGCCVAAIINGIADSFSVNSLWTWPVMWIVMGTAMGVVRFAPLGKVTR